MKQLKKVPRKQLEKFSTIFMQIGLVLALFIVFISLEYKTEQKEVLVDLYEPGDKIYTLEFDKIPVFVKEVEVKQQPKKQVAEVFLDEIIPVKEKKEIIETVINKKQEEEVVQVNVNDIVTAEEPDDINDVDEPQKPIVLSLATKIPVFKGCENLSKVESRKCFDKKIGKLVKRNFDVDLANELGLKSGKHKMYTQFVIDETGKVVDVKVGTDNKSLEKEAKRIVNKIPDFTPGESHGKKVSVKYTLPINFYVQ